MLDGVEDAEEEAHEAVDLDGEILQNVAASSKSLPGINKLRLLKDRWEIVKDDTGEICKVIRHHCIPRKALFTPSQARGLTEVDSKQLAGRRETEVRYITGEIHRDVSDWRAADAGNKLLKGTWIGKTVFQIQGKEEVRVCALATTGDSIDLAKVLKAGWESNAKEVRELCYGRKSIARSDPEFGKIVRLLLNEESVTPSEIILQFGFNRVRANRYSESSETIYFLLGKQEKTIKLVECGEDKSTEDFVLALTIKILIVESIEESIFKISRLPQGMQDEFRFKDKLIDIKPEVLIAAGLEDYLVRAIKKEYSGLLQKVQNNGGTVAQIYEEGVECKQEEGGGRLINDLPKLSDYLAKIKVRGVLDGSQE